MAYIPDSGSVAAWLQSGSTSIIAVSTGVPNQSVSGTIQVGNFPTTQNVSGSVVTWIQSSNASVITVGSPVANQSVSGSLGASVLGHAPVVIVGGSIAASFTPPANQSVSGTVQVDNFPTTQNVSGSVITWIASSNASVITVGSPVANQSVSGTVQVEMLSTSASIITVGQPAANQSVSGTVNIAGNPSISGTVLIGNTNVNVGGSVVAFQGTTPWAVNAGGSVIAVIQGSSLISILQAPSIAGTYTDDSAHTTGDRGLFILGVRNDTMASVTSSDSDYTPTTMGPAGETIVANAPITTWVQGTTSIFNGTSMVAIAAQGASVFTYVTAVQVANVGATSVLVTLFGGTSSVIGYTVAPQGGGSNIYFPNGLKTRQNAAFTASISGVASVFLSAQGFTARI